MSQTNRLAKEQAALSAATKDIRQYVARIVDDMSFVEMNAFAVGKDRVDGAPVVGEGVLCGTATVDGQPVVVIAQNHAALYGSLGKATADKICRALDFAIRNDLSVISILDSDGMRVGEGVEVLEGMGAVLAKVNEYSAYADGVHFAIVKGQALGLMAVYAKACDYVVSVGDAVLSVVAPAVLGKAQPAQKAADFAVKDVDEAAALVEGLLCWQNVGLGTEDDPNRETALVGVDAEALLAALLDEGKYIEYRADAGKVRCVFGYVNGTAVGVLATADKQLGKADADKASDFVRLLAKAQAPLVTLVDADGFADDDQAALGEALVNLTAFLADVPAKIAVIAGDAVGSAYTVLASKGLGYDYSVAFASAVVSPIAPQAAVHLMYGDVLKEKGNTPKVQAAVAAMYAEDKCDAFQAAAAGYVDEVIDPDTLRPYVANALTMLVQ